MDEQQRDNALHIQTSQIQQGFHESLHHNRYEPTPYALLDVLFDQYGLTRSDRLIDYGCGKGRLIFYVNQRFGAQAVGIEMDEKFCLQALENLNAYEKLRKAKGEIRFMRCFAQDYGVEAQDNKFYFFNPFSVQIFIAVINNILKSFERDEREIDLILFFPSDEYIDFLEHRTLFELAEEIELPSSAKDLRERFLVYRLMPFSFEIL